MSLRSSISSRPAEIPASFRIAAAIAVGAALTVLGLAGITGRPPAALDIVVGWVVLACGIGLGRSRPASARSGTLMAITGLAWLAGGVLYRGPLAHLLLAWPGGRLTWPLRVVTAFAYADAVLESWNPVDAMTIAYGLALAAAGIARVATSTGHVRRGRLLAAAGSVVVGSLLVIDRLGLVGSSTGSGLLVLYELLVAGLLVAMTLDVRRGAWARGAATGLVVELGSRAGGTLRDRLATVLGDPTLVVGYAQPGGGFADEGGQPVELPPNGSGRAVMPVREGAEVVSVIVHDATVIDDEALAGAVAAAARLAVANARLRDEVDEHVRQLDASQRRILTAADDQRRSIEHRLAAGALTRLERVETIVNDDLLADVLGAAPVDVQGAVRAADDELRAFARGVYPPALTTGGLAAAIAELAAAGTLPVTVTIEGGRLPVDVETTAYFVCAEALANASKHARAGHVTITGSTAGESLALSIADDGVGGADPSGWGLLGLRDRVAALGGTLDVDSPAGGGTTVRAVIPVRQPFVERTDPDS